jgi:hypothetical protein
LLAREPDGLRPSGINASLKHSERGGETTPGTRNVVAEERESLVRHSGGYLDWEPLRRNSSSRLASGHGESGSYCP